ncbi:hypothetical protein V1511DRAFT_511450 [Dipodascopsis uninucleata]
MKTATYTLTAITVSAAAYALYFDYQRRHSPNFRKKLRQNERKYRKTIELSKQKELEEAKETLKESIIQSLKDDPVTVTSAAQFESLMSQELMKIDAYMRQGDKKYNDMVISIYRLLVLHPVPAQILEALKQNIPEEVMQLVLEFVKILPIPGFSATAAESNVQSGATSSLD